MNEETRITGSSARQSPLIWALFLLLCAIGAAAAIRRIAALITPPTAARVPELASLDNTFAAHTALTLCHIIPALAFVLLAPAWFLPAVRRRPAMHRSITYALLILGVVVGITALMLSRHPIGGVNEAAAAILYDCLFLFSLGRAGFLLQHRDTALHRTWMLRSIAVLLGIATTRPVMGAFFATESLTHLHPQQFFGTAFWIGFTTTYIAGEAYIRSHPVEAQERTGIVERKLSV
jgi:hypothetical protein